MMAISPPPSLSDVDLSTTRYAERSRQLMEIVSNLRAIGAQTVIDLPRIVVIGCQSAGKSSLVEAVTGVRVPRDSGICTRCPVECSLYSTSDTWSCKISLRLDWDAQDRYLEETKLISFGHEIHDKSTVELRLRQAQAAILNPYIASETFLTKTEDDLKYYRTQAAFEHRTLKFSRNTVVVDIYDPESADLSFIDLPGLIQNEEDETVRLLEKLVTTNIQGNCIILVTIPMSDEMENQRAKRLAQEADPRHVRTIGVLTKPDMLTPGNTTSRDRWVRVLKGQEHPLKHGYYCVRLADDSERTYNLSRADMEAIAEQFFAETSPWDRFLDRGRFGIPSLVKNLSRLLIDVIDQSLPKLREDVFQKIDECKEALSQLPPAVKPDACEILTMLSEFCNDFSAMIYGSSRTQDSKLFIQDNRNSYAEFKRKIRATAPDFRPFIDGAKYTPIEDRSEDDFHQGTGDGDVDSRVTLLDLKSIRDIIKQSIAWELPRNVPFDAKSQLIKNCIELWDEPVIACYDTVGKRVDSALQTQVQSHFARFPALRTHIWSLINTKIEQAKAEALTDVKKALKLEKNPFFTQNSHYLDAVRERWIKLYRDARRNSSHYLKSEAGKPVVKRKKTNQSFAPAAPQPQALAIRAASPPPPWHQGYGYMSTPPSRGFNPAPEQRALEALADLGYTGLSVDDLGRLNQSDSFEEEIMVMADVRAYFQVAYKRIIDSIPLTIEHSLNQHLADTLQKSLVQQLDFGGPEANMRLASLLAEDPDIAARRDELQAKLKRLEQVQQELRGFGI